jgi:Tfp pilus assembly protein PilV
MQNKRFARGVSLVEAMVAVAVMAFGMLAVVGVQATLRLNGDVAKQRSEATRIAQEAMESRRAFAVVDTTAGLPAWADIASSGPTDVAGPATNTTFSVQSNVVTYVDPPAKAVRVTVRWNDRAGQPQEVMLSSAIAAAAPGLSGTLAVRPGTASVAPVRRPFRRHPSIPTQAREMGSSSVFVPPFRPTMLLVFDNVTGLVTGACTFTYNTETNNISYEELTFCNSNSVIGQLLSGFVRYQRTTSGPDLTAADVENPIGPALNVLVNLILTSSGHPPGSFCIDDTNATTLGDGTQRLTTYFCVVYSNAAALWSGTTTIEPRFDSFVISDDDSASPGADDRYRVCRYTPATSDAQPVTNADHPRNYTDVAGNLTNQNFVVISSRKHCPIDVPANPSAGDFINTNTLQHQPAPS